MPPPGGIAGMGDSFFGFSATMASVVMSSPAIEAASCRAVRPLGHQVTVLAFLGIVAVGISVILADLADDLNAGAIIPQRSGRIFR
jgi:hypothetical protein